MTLDDLKSWWKTYSPIIKEAKKRNNLTLLNNYVKVYKGHIKDARQKVIDEDELKTIKRLERALEEIILSVTLNLHTSAPEPQEEQPKQTIIDKANNFIEEIRERYGKGTNEQRTDVSALEELGKGGVRKEERGGEEEGRVAEEEEKRGEGEEGERGGLGDKFGDTFERVDGGRRDVKNPTYHFDTHLDTSKKSTPTQQNDLDTLNSLIYNIEQFIGEKGEEDQT